MEKIIYVPTDTEASLFTPVLALRLLQSVMLALGLTVFQPALALSPDSTAKSTDTVSSAEDLSATANSPVKVTDAPNLDASSAGEPVSVSNGQSDHWMALFQSTYVWQKNLGLTRSIVGRIAYLRILPKAILLALPLFLAGGRGLVQKFI